MEVNHCNPLLESGNSIKLPLSLEIRGGLSRISQTL